MYLQQLIQFGTSHWIWVLGLPAILLLQLQAVPLLPRLLQPLQISLPTSPLLLTQPQIIVPIMVQQILQPQVSLTVLGIMNLLHWLSV